MRASKAMLMTTSMSGAVRPSNFIQRRSSTRVSTRVAACSKAGAAAVVSG